MTPRLTPAEQERHMAEGEAALMLVECLAIALVEQGLLTGAQVTDAIETVIETKLAAGGETEDAAISEAAVGLLHAMASSIAAAPSPTDGRGA